jgi:sarcosine oxidase
VLRHAVTSVRLVAGGFELSGDWGSVHADRVLLATGAFGSELLDDRLQLERYPRTTVTAELSSPLPLPSLIAVDVPDPRLVGIYWVPPIVYPDGRRALKIGGDLRNSESIPPDGLVEWFRSDGDAVEVEALRRSLQALLPGVPVSSWAHVPCMVTNTPTGHPYIGWIDDGLAVAIGGNGSAAKSSDELGRLASTLFSEAGWSDSIPAEVFAPLLT